MPESDGGAEAQITFTRIIVHADGHEEIEGVTPPARPDSSPMLPSLLAVHRRNIGIAKPCRRFAKRVIAVVEDQD
jgi:hypothetical protein